MLADAAELAANWERWLHDGPLEILPTPASRVPLHRKSTLRERPNRTVGSGVIAERTTGVCEARERGVCYEEYTLPDQKGGQRPGWSFLFEQGRYDGFSPNEVELILEVTGDICPDVAGYEFTSVLRLRADYHRGRFAPAFPPEQRATVQEAAANPILCGEPTMIELETLAARLLALADRMETDPAAAQEPLAREAYRLRRFHQEVVAGLTERRLAEVPAAPSPTRRWCG